MPGGADKFVDYEERTEYIRLVRNCRMAEGKAQVCKFQIGRGRTRRSGESANKSGRAKRELSTGGGGRANYSPESSQANDSSENCLLLS